MGWKNLKEHFRIEHMVQVTEAGICIGSPYIHDIIVVGMDGKILKRHDSNAGSLGRYQTEIDADPDLARRLIETEDTFMASITVYTYAGAEIIEKQCEEPGWPNVTHDGLMMHENTFSTDRDQVVIWAKRNAQAGIDWRMDSIAETAARLTNLHQQLSRYRDDLAMLEATYPPTPTIGG